MRTVEVLEAKARFSALVADALSGKTTIVTRNGKPVAQIGPVVGQAHRAQLAVRRLTALRNKLSREGRLKSVDIRALIDERRK